MGKMTHYTGDFIHVYDFGATGNGITDDTAAIQAAIDTAGTVGAGAIIFPVGTFKFTTLDLQNKGSITLRGPNHRMTGAGATLESDVTGSGTIVNARKADNFALENIAIKYSSPLFTGVLLDLGGGTRAMKIIDSRLSSVAVHTIQTATLLRLTESHTVSIEGSFFGGCDKSIVGHDGSFNADDWVNCLYVSGCFFDGAATAYIYNAATAWSFSGCLFEASNGVPRGLAGVANAGRSVSFNDCWFGDDIYPGVWLDWYGVGLTVAGCHLSAEHSDTTAIRLRGRDSGLNVSGNTMRGSGALIDASDVPDDTAGISVLANHIDRHTSGVVWRDGVVPPSALWQDRDGATRVGAAGNIV